MKSPYLWTGLVGRLVEEVLDELVERFPVGMLAVLDAVVALDGEATRLGIRRLLGSSRRIIISVIAVVTVVTVVSLISALLLANLNLT